MGVFWGVDISFCYALEVETLSCWSRFATRCLKLRGPAKSGRGKRKQSAVVKLPGEDLTEEELVDDGPFESYPFSDTEEEVAAMPPKHRGLRAELHRWLDGNHAMSLFDTFEDSRYLKNTNEMINKCFKAAVGRLLPGHGRDFEFHVTEYGGKVLTYITYAPLNFRADEEIEMPRESVRGIPWGNALTALPTLSDAKSASVNASFAVLVERLGLTAVGEPGMKMLSSASGG